MIKVRRERSREVVGRKVEISEGGEVEECLSGDCARKIEPRKRPLSVGEGVRADDWGAG